MVLLGDQSAAEVSTSRRPYKFGSYSRVARVMVRYKDQIIEPDNDRLLSIGSKIKMDVFPMTLQGAVTTVLGLGIFRLALGLGEGGGFPGSSRAISEWFPVKERASAFGLINT
jgi:MFS family permease